MIVALPYYGVFETFLQVRTPMVPGRLFPGSRAPAQVRRRETWSQHIEGVEKVVNNIESCPPPSTTTTCAAMLPRLSSQLV